MNNNLQNLNAIVARLIEVAIDLRRAQSQNNPVDGLVSTVGDSEPAPAPIASGLSAVARRLLKEADERSRYFEDGLFCDPVWHILLDLYAHAGECRRVSVSDACVAARVPPTTALRWIATLMEQGIVEKGPDPHDRRRFYVNLSRSALDAMSSYLADISGLDVVLTPGNLVPMPQVFERERSVVSQVPQNMRI